MITSRVTFNETITVCHVLNIEDYSDSEIDDAWYDGDEMDKITNRCFKIINKFENGTSKNSRKYCIRGLEGHTRLGSISKRHNRAAAYIAVLNEQERHRDEDEDVRTQAMSDAYQRTSSSCQRWAQVVGSRDEQAVEGYLDDEEEEEEDTTLSSSSVGTLLKSSPYTKCELGEKASIAVVSARAA